MVGIDLGTTNSLVAVFEGGETRILSNEMGAPLTPSAVAVSEDGRVLVGSAAKDRMVADPGSGKTQFKRDMGESVRYRFGGRDWTPVDCSALILQEMKRIAEMELGKPVESAVITVPAYFRDEQRNATLEAARIAGLKVERIINEPTAAALAYGYKNPEIESTLLVFDLGGGTFDVTLLEAYDGIVEVKASAGASHLGGEDFTDAFAQWILEKAEWKPKYEDERRWRQHVEMVKRRLSKQDKATVTLGTGELEVTLEDLSRATISVSERIYPVVARCLRDANVSYADLDDILLIGGATRDRNLLERLARESGRLPNRKMDPDQVVAMGAAVQAALCQEDAAVDDIVLTDVCPHTLGIEVSRLSSPGSATSGYFAPIIDRNTTVPVSRSDVFHTLGPEQDEIRLRVFQGESRKVAENRQIGEVLVRNLRKKEGQKRAGEAEVRFSYDMNGMLEVEVTVLHSGEKTRCVIQKTAGALSEAEIRESLEKLAPLKIHPRDKLEHRARVERASRLYKELIGVQRDELSFRLEKFENALDSQSEKEINIASHALDTFLSPFFSIDGEYDGSLTF